jgi:four helix bundle suffix protein
MDNNDTTLLAPSGDYHQLICYQKAVIVYDLTYWFCERYMERSKDRTVDQMVQAARSGKQNIVEGITDGAASKESELKLLKVAAGSLHELHEDYEDWLRSHQHPIWAKDSVEMKALWAVGKEHSDSEYFMQLARTRPPETTANIARGMTEQAIFFLDRLIQSKVKQFVENGGLKEQMYRVRQQYRQQSGYYNKGSNGINGMNGIN